MKIKNLLYLLLAMPLLVVSCNDDSDEVNKQPKDPKFTLGEVTEFFVADGGQGVINFTLENAREGIDVVATPDEATAAWVSGFEYAADKVTYTVAANTATVAREGKITVTYGEFATHEVSFTQAAASNEDGGEDEKTPSLSISSETIMSFAANGGLGKITYVLKNKVEDVVVTAEPLFAEGVEPWITEVTVGTLNDITFTVLANEGNARSASIVVKYGDYVEPLSVVVKQSGKPHLELTSNSNEAFTKTGGSGVITYKLSNPVNDTLVEAEVVAVNDGDDTSWLTLGTLGVGEIPYTVAVNESAAREAKIVVKYGDYSSFTVNVTQVVGEELPSILNVDKTYLEFESRGGNLELNYTVSNPVEGGLVEAILEGDVIGSSVVADNTAAAGVISVGTYNSIVEADSESVLTINYYVNRPVEEGTDAPEATPAADEVETPEEGGEEVATEKVILSTVEVKVLQKAYVVPRIELNILSARVAKGGSSQWFLYLKEENSNLANPDLRLEFYYSRSDRKNAAYNISDGTYTFEGTTKLVAGAVGSFGQHEGSLLRYETSEPLAITEGTVTVTTNKDSETMAFTGEFKCDNIIYSFSYEGAVGDAYYTDPSVAVTEWKSFDVTSRVADWLSTKPYLYTIVATSADEKFNVEISLLTALSEDTGLPVGTYSIKDYVAGVAYCENAKINGVKMVEGDVVVESAADGKMKLSYKLKNAGGMEFNGSYEGEF